MFTRESQLGGGPIHEEALAKARVVSSEDKFSEAAEIMQIANTQIELLPEFAEWQRKWWEEHGVAEPDYEHKQEVIERIVEKEKVVYQDRKAVAYDGVIERFANLPETVRDRHDQVLSFIRSDETRLYLGSRMEDPFSNLSTTIRGVLDAVRTKLSIDISEHQLRDWEKKGFVNPTREIIEVREERADRKGQRLYSASEVNWITTLVYGFSQGAFDSEDVQQLYNDMRTDKPESEIGGNL